MLDSYLLASLLVAQFYRGSCQNTSTCASQGGSNRKLKLNKEPAEAFIEFTRNTVDAAKLFLADNDYHS